MFCPRCGGEYRSGFTECADCLVPLVAQRPEVPPTPSDSDMEFVTIFRTGNAALIPLATSLLESAEIGFITRGEGVQDLIGWGRFPAGLNAAVGPVEFQVASDDAEEAGSLLVDLVERDETDQRSGDEVGNDA
jgi:Putative prokaryotic signal transducing protein